MAFIRQPYVMSARYSCRIVAFALISPGDQSPFWMYSLSVSDQGDLRVLKTDEEFWQFHSSLKQFRELGIEIPKHPRASWSLADEADMPSRQAELQAYINAILSIQPTHQVPAESLPWSNFLRAVDSFFEANIICTYARLGNISAIQRNSEGPTAVDVNARDASCSTALHFAVAFGHVELVQYLLSHGAISSCDQFGLSPADIAQRMGETRLAMLPMLGVATDVSLVSDQHIPLQYKKLSTQRTILFLVNPFGGTQKAPTVFKSVVAPIMRLAGVPFTCQETQHGNHAGEIARDLNLSETDTVVTVSGDGLFHEVMNGLAVRPDAAQALRHPVGMIPAGSANGLAGSIGWAANTVLASRQIARGLTRPLDLLSVQQPSKGLRCVAHLMVSWGMISDIDFESEHYRWMGSFRFTWVALQRIFSKQPYHCKLHFLPAPPLTPVQLSPPSSPSDPAGCCSTAAVPPVDAITKCRVAFCRVCSAHARPAQPQHLLCSPFIDSNWPLSPHEQAAAAAADMPAAPFVPPAGWVTIENHVDLLVIGNLPAIGTEMKINPRAHFADGAMDICVATGCSRLDHIGVLLNIEDGSHLSDKEHVAYHKATHCVLEPLDRDSLVDIDGERYANEQTFLSVLPGLASLAC